MPKRRHKPEEIVAKLRQVDVLTPQGQNIADAVRSIGVTEVTYCCWRQEYELMVWMPPPRGIVRYCSAP